MSLPEANLPSPSEGTLAQLGGKLIKGAVGLFGITGILYGAGFLALRSHFAFLGIWSGVPANTNLVAEEGARFFYHLILLPAGLITQTFTDLHLTLGYGFLGLLVAALLWDRRQWLYRRLAKHSEARQTSLARRLYTGSPVFCSIAVLVLTTILLFPQWQITSLQDVVRVPNAIPTEMKAELQDRASLYNQVVIRLVFAIVGALFLYHIASPAAGRAARVLIAMQWLLVLAALLTLPVAYGRLILPTTYPVFSLSDASVGERLLIEETPEAWILWNSALKQTEIVPKDKARSVAIGARKSVLP
jgi:hypothetical protein